MPKTFACLILCIASVLSQCTHDIGLVIPLYIYPGTSGTAWQSIANAISAATTPAHVIGIVNPASGPTTTPDANYVSGMQLLMNAGVQLVGYVPTTYGSRLSSSVTADIDTYATSSWNTYISGIFFDEAASTNTAYVSYYQTLYNYTKSSNLTVASTADSTPLVITNPGVSPDESYLTTADIIIRFENTESAWNSATWTPYTSPPSTVHFGAMVHSISSLSTDYCSIRNKAVDYNFEYLYALQYSTSTTWTFLASQLDDQVDIDTCACHCSATNPSSLTFESSVIFPNSDTIVFPWYLGYSPSRIVHGSLDGGTTTMAPTWTSMANTVTCQSYGEIWHSWSGLLADSSKYTVDGNGDVVVEIELTLAVPETSVVTLTYTVQVPTTTGGSL